MLSREDLLKQYDKDRDITRAALKLKQNCSAKTLKSILDLEDQDLQRLVEQLRLIGVAEHRITYIQDQWYGFDSLLIVYKGKEAELYENLVLGKANIAHKGKNCWMERNSPEFKYLLERLGQKVNGK